MKFDPGTVPDADILGRVSVIAVLRHIRPDEVVDVAEALLEGGVVAMEVTLNTADAFQSIEKLVDRFSDRALIGAGTVLRAHEVREVAAIGGKMIISPNTNVDIIAETKKAGLLSLPGCLTPSEAFAALHAGADALKFFPTEIFSPEAMGAMKAVVPAGTRMFAVGGINADNLAAYFNAGACGIGVGSNLFKPGKPVETIASDTAELVNK